MRCRDGIWVSVTPVKLRNARSAWKETLEQHISPCANSNTVACSFGVSLHPLQAGWVSGKGEVVEPGEKLPARDGEEVGRLESTFGNLPPG